MKDVDGCKTSNDLRDRYNAAGRLRIRKRADHIIQRSPDTSVRDEEWLTGIGFKNKAVIIDNEDHGNGIYNMKMHMYAI